MKTIQATFFLAIFSIGQAFALSVGDVALTSEAHRVNSVVSVKAIKPNGTVLVKVLNYPNNVMNSDGQFTVSQASLTPAVKEITVNGLKFRPHQTVKARLFRHVFDSYILYTFANGSILVTNAENHAEIESFKRNGAKAFDEDIFSLYLKSGFSSDSQIWW